MDEHVKKGTAEESMRKAELQRRRNERSQQVRRLAIDMLMAKYPKECTTKVKKHDSLKLIENHPAEYRMFREEAREELNERLGVIRMGSGPVTPTLRERVERLEQQMEWVIPQCPDYEDPEWADEDLEEL